MDMKQINFRDELDGYFIAETPHVPTYFFKVLRVPTKR